MQYYDINNCANTVSLYDAVINCVGANRGLYLPVSTPIIPRAFLNNFDDMSLREIAYATSNLFLSPDVDSATVKSIVDKAFAFDVPVVQLSDGRFIVELFHGPTGVYKDFAIIFMAELMRHFKSLTRRPVKVLMSSTGNSAAAVANAFADIDNVEVYLLVPLSRSKDLILPKWSSSMSNIHLVEVAGSVSDCNGLMTSAFDDKSLSDKFVLTSSNSVNICRIISQIVLFFYTASRLKLYGNGLQRLPYGLPSVNLSLLAAGIMSRQMGLDCGTFVAAFKDIDGYKVFDDICRGHIDGDTILSRTTPNVLRILRLLQSDCCNLQNDIKVAYVTEQQICNKIANCCHTCNYVMGSRTALAACALDMTKGESSPGVIFATNAPYRSSRLLAGLSIDINGLSSQPPIFDTKSWHKDIIPPSYPALRKILNL